MESRSFVFCGNMGVGVDMTYLGCCYRVVVSFATVSEKGDAAMIFSNVWGHSCLGCGCGVSFV